MAGTNDGTLLEITCRTCGFKDYVTDEQWCNGPGGGVWAFTWWNGTNKDKPCICPKCGNEIYGGFGSSMMKSGHFGMGVVWEEEIVP